MGVEMPAWTHRDGRSTESEREMGRPVVSRRRERRHKRGFDEHELKSRAVHRRWCSRCGLAHRHVRLDGTKDESASRKSVDYACLGADDGNTMTITLGWTASRRRWACAV